MVVELVACVSEVCVDIADAVIVPVPVLVVRVLLEPVVGSQELQAFGQTSRANAPKWSSTSQKNTLSKHSGGSSSPLQGKVLVVDWF